MAERLCRFADIVGRERVMAGSDCGFGTFAGYGKLDPDIAFKKLHGDGRRRRASPRNGCGIKITASLRA